jgi:hypothetical protein
VTVHGLRDQDFISDKPETSLRHRCVQTGSWYIQESCNGCRVAKWPGSQADSLSASGVEVKNA